MSEQGLEDAIAVVGMAGRFPGAEDVAAFWRNIREGVESVSFFTEDELAAAGVPAEVYRSPDYVPARAVLSGWDGFDAEFFDYSARDAEYMDPQQRLFLEVAWSALEDAGIAPSRAAGRVGVYAGASLSTYLLWAVGGDPALLQSFYAMDDLSLLLGTSGDFVATRIAYKLGLTGPATTIQTACSTSLVAIHNACQSLLYAECDVAIAGGSSVSVPHGVGYLYREGGAKSQDGRCRAFDAAAGGAVGGSGVGAVVLKRLADALADADHVHAVVRGSAVNNDGAVKVGFTAPSVTGQAEVIGEAIEVSGLDPASIGLVEAHGTGTALGDPIEVAALTRAWRRFTDERGFCALGSVKTNVGHLDSAAGVAGFIKAVLAVREGVLPPSLNFTAPNPAIDFASSPFFVNTESRPWVAEGPRRAAVSAFGMGGTNAHAIVEQAPPRGATGPVRRWQVLTVSARSAAALTASCERLADRLADGGIRLADAAFTLQTGREQFAYRRAIVAEDIAGAVAALRAPAPGPAAVATRRPVAFAVVDGEVDPALHRACLEHEPAYREHFACSERDALVRVWESWGVRSSDPQGTDTVVLRVDQPDPGRLLADLADLWAQGVDIDWTAFSAAEDRRRVPLPTYPFQHRAYRIRHTPTATAPTAPDQEPEHERPDLPTPYLAPRDEVERRVVAIWRDLLRYREIGVDDNFFALGGDSLLAADVVAELRDGFGLDLPMERVMAAPTPAEQAELVRALLVERVAAMTDEQARALVEPGAALDHGQAP
ncbi:beta-ketoacyl synthase N-terminal-like domain-containing protein [Actinokineospora sp. G85]|uniref:type I polyketide synthase n=1 Tax=Actinokineospora sp. G85 TaxID=3406626 RepID=UPI003C764123